MRVPKVAQRKVGSLTERATRVGGNGKENTKLGTARHRQKRTGLPMRDLEREIEAKKVRIKREGKGCSPVILRIECLTFYIQQSIRPTDQK